MQWRNAGPLGAARHSIPRMDSPLPMMLARAGLLALSLVLPPLTAASGQVLSPDQRSTYAAALSALESGRGDEARRLAAEGQNALASKLLQWIELQAPRNGASFEEIAGFIQANPDWPAQEFLIRRGEEALSDFVADSTVLAWFGDRRPATADGALRLTEALFRSGDSARATKLIVDAWRSMAMGEKQERYLRSRYEHILSQADHVARLDNLLWDGRRDDVQRMLPLVDPGWRALAEARLRLAAQGAGVEALVARVPEKLRADPGLAFERARWRRRNGQLDGAAEIMLRLPSQVSRPDKVWSERAAIARRLAAEGRAREAYRIARAHGLDGGPGFAEIEWLAGWIALQHLRENDTGMKHFTRLYENVRFPVSRSRAAFWAGRAAEAKGDTRAAQDWYRRSAESMTTYYGQLAWARLDGTRRPSWPRTPEVAAADRAAFERNELVQAVKVLNELARLDRVKPFLLRLTALATTPAQHALVADLTVSLGRPDLAVSVAKRSIQAGVALPEHGYPVMELPSDHAPLEPPLILATIRQESAFEADAISRAGARGLMQLMPATARAVARQLGLAHADYQLTADTNHNIRLGSAYLYGLLDDFDGSYVLALAGYNAGPGRVRQWLRDFGDPRNGAVDLIDWIESIPIEETRNYVQRVLENLQLYRQRLGQTQLAHGQAGDLGWRR